MLHTTTKGCYGVLICGVLLLTQIAGCGGGNGAAPDDTIASIKITPDTVMLTGTGESRRLTAQAFNVAGAPLDANITWSSTKSDKVSVEADGRITSLSTVGSAVITATAGGVTSAPVLVSVATPVSGAVLLKDVQIIGSPELIDPTVAVLNVGTRYKVMLAGVPAPALGSIMMAAETSPVGGRVVDVQTVNGQVAVTLEIVPLKDMFSALVIDETLDLKNVKPIIPDAILSQYDVTREANGKMVFTPKAGVAAALSSAKAMFAGRQAASAANTLGPFKCETTSTFPLVNAVNPSVSLNPSLQVIFQYDDKNGGLQRFSIKGGLEGEIKNNSTFDAAFEGAIECKAEFMAYPIPVGGPLALIIGGQVPVGLGFKVGGKIIAAQVGFDMSAKASANMEVGFACPGGASCAGVTDFKPDASASINWRVPPELNDPWSQLKLEPAVFGFAYADFSLGNPMIQALRVNTFGGKFGPALGGSFATPAVQMLDTTYQSKYQLTLDAIVEASTSFRNLCDWLTITPFKLELKTSYLLANSPTPTKITADTDDYNAGDTVIFTVELDPANLNFGTLISNVGAVQILRSQGGTITTVPGSQGQNVYTLSWIATESGTIKDNFFAFVQTNLLPLPTIGSLELGPVAPKVLTNITISPANSSVLTDMTAMFTATGTYADGTSAPLKRGVQWTSDTTAVASISGDADGTGFATGVAAGTATITATSGKISGSTTLSVKKANLLSIAVTPANSATSQGMTQWFTAIGTLDNNSSINMTRSVTWSSDTPSVALVDAIGVAMGVAPGTATITATSSAISGSATLTVTEAKAKAITFFMFTSPAAIGTIDQAAKTISVKVPRTDFTALVALFTTTGVSVKVGGVEQVSGVTANDFTNPVAYTVTKQDGSTDTYFVSVTSIFTDNGDGTMTDTRTGLMWIKSPATQGFLFQLSWDYCYSLNFAGHADWRLPTLGEFNGLIQGWSESTPAAWLIAQGFSSNVQADYYWSSSYSDWGNPWALSMLNGYTMNTDDQLISHYVWPVRTATLP